MISTKVSKKDMRTISRIPTTALALFLLSCSIYTQLTGLTGRYERVSTLFVANEFCRLLNCTQFELLPRKSCFIVDSQSCCILV